MADISPLFAIPVAIAKHPDPDPLNADLRTLFLAREAEGDRHRNPNPLVLRNAALYESNFDLFRWPDPPIQALKAFCWQHLFQTVRELNGYSDQEIAERKVFNDAWFHVTRDSGFFGAHNHPMATWSGVYCVSDGDPAGSGDVGGELSFLNPFPAANMFVDAGIARFAPPFSWGNLHFRLQPGQLILFPSWLLHEVAPYHGSSERITVAFNCWFQ